VDAGSLHTDAREFLTVVGVAVGGLALAAVAAFVPWYEGPERTGAVVELHAPVAADVPEAPAEER
jgi:hypothetical protein